MNKPTKSLILMAAMAGLISGCASAPAKKECKGTPAGSKSGKASCGAKGGCSSKATCRANGNCGAKSS